MIYTDKKLYFEPKLIEKINLMIERTVKRKADNLLIVEGDEGMGKSNMAAGIAYYISWKMGRKYTIDNVHFDPQKMINYAVKKNEQIIHWDEVALAGLASEWQRKIQKTLIKLLMIARKRKHFYIFCIPKFQKLNEYIIERAVGMIRVYAAKGIDYGRFVYYNKKRINELLRDYKKRKLPNYHKWTFRGRFLQYLPKVLNEEEYDKKKDEAIRSLLKEDSQLNNKYRQELIKLKYRIYTLPGMTLVEKAKHLKVSGRSLTAWGHLAEKYPQILGKDGN